MVGLAVLLPILFAAGIASRHVWPDVSRLKSQAKQERSMGAPQ